MPEDVIICDDTSKFETEAQVAKLKQLLKDAGEIGCEAALRKHDHNVAYLMDEKRARYLEIVDIQQQEDVLEVGSSMGQHSRLIAKQCRKLDGLEVVEDQARFASLWCRQCGADNVKMTAGGASGALPYSDASFDVVIMNYVLEWCAGREIDNPDEFHLRLLKEVRRVLKPSGRFFLSTKNRYGLRLLLGSVDEHLGVRFGNALPRWIGRALSRGVARDIPRGHLHSRRALERLLREAGFARIDAYLSFPDARRPDIITLFDKGGAEMLRELDHSKYSKKDRLYLALPRSVQEQTATSHTFIARAV